MTLNSRGSKLDADWSLSREWLGASEISTLWINYVDIRASEPLFPSTRGWMVEKNFSKKCSRDRLYRAFH